MFTGMGHGCYFAKHMGVVFRGGSATTLPGFAGRILLDFLGRRALVLQICWDLILGLVVASMFSWIRWFYGFTLLLLRLRYRGLHGLLR